MDKAKVEVLKMVLGLAYADGQLEENESRLVEFLIDSYGLDPEEEKAVREQTKACVDTEQLAELVTDQNARQKAYEAALLVSLMDGEKQREESEMLDKLKRSLEISELDAVKIETKARQIYERFQEKQNG